jgi:hypothetical protein
MIALVDEIVGFGHALVIRCDIKLELVEKCK